MYEALSIAASGLKNQQRRLDTIAHNVANANTNSYKSSRLDFKDALYTAGITPGPARTPEGNQQKGHGLMVAGIAKDYRTGNLQTTDRPLDIAIEGEGFFELGDYFGGLVYTRNGSFHLSVEEDGNFLASAEGLYVHDTEGERINVPFGTHEVNVGIDGTIYFMADNEIIGTATLGIYTFRNITGLLSEGNSNYSESVASGERRPAEGVKVWQGVLEGSNVNLAEEMTRLIRTQRAFSLASRALTTADEMEGIANNMKR